MQSSHFVCLCVCAWLVLADYYKSCDRVSTNVSRSTAMGEKTDYYYYYYYYQCSDFNDAVTRTIPGHFTES